MFSEEEGGNIYFTWVLVQNSQIKKVSVNSLRLYEIAKWTFNAYIHHYLKKFLQNSYRLVSIILHRPSDMSQHLINRRRKKKTL